MCDVASKKWSSACARDKKGNKDADDDDDNGQHHKKKSSAMSGMIHHWMIMFLVWCSWPAMCHPWTCYRTCRCFARMPPCRTFLCPQKESSALPRPRSVPPVV